VFAKDGINKVETHETEQFLKDLVGKENVMPSFNSLPGVIVYWICNGKLLLLLFIPGKIL
jgi:hypothetical protein